MNRIRELSADEEARRLAFVRERAIRDEVSLLDDAKREGELTGERRVLHRLLTKRFGDLPVWVNEKLAMADSKQLDEWADAILAANSINDAF